MTRLEGRSKKLTPDLVRQMIRFLIFNACSLENPENKICSPTPSMKFILGYNFSVR